MIKRKKKQKRGEKRKVFKNRDSAMAAVEIKRGTKVLAEKDIQAKFLDEIKFKKLSSVLQDRFI